jgi:hypothetical protein
MTTAHRMMNLHRETRRRYLERAGTATYTRALYLNWASQERARMAYWAQLVADELGYPRRSDIV